MTPGTPAMRSDVGRLFRVSVGPRFRPLVDLPGPAPLFPWGNALQFITRFPWEVLADLAPRYGRLFAIWILNRPFVVLNDAELVGQVLDSNSDDYYKSDPVSAFRPLTPGGSLFIANGSEWRNLRDRDPYARADQSRLHDSQAPRIDEWVRRWTAQPLETAPAWSGDATATLQRLVFDCFALALWGEPCDEQTYQDFNRMGDEGARRVSVPPLAALPPLDPRFYAARQRWQRTFDERIARARRETRADRGDLLQRAVAEPTSLPDPELRVALASMFYGGVYSVTSAVVNTLYCLSGDEPFARRVREELDVTRGAAGGAPPGVPGDDSLLDAALRESLRLLAPVPIFLRNVRPDRSTTLDGHTLPPDTSLIVAPWLFHRAPGHWEDATEFRPERWLRGARSSDPIGSPYFFPFGRGPRACVAQSFGWFAMKRVLASLLTSARIQVTGRWRPSFYFGVQMPRGLELRLAR